MKLQTETLVGLALFLCTGYFTVEAADGPCFWKKNGSVFNLEPLASTSSSPRFSSKFDNEVENTTEAIVFYNPCKPFSISSVCKDAAACLSINIFHRDIETVLAKQENISWSKGEDNVLVYYYEGQSLEVQLICDPKLQANNSTFAVSKITKDTTKAVLTSMCACKDGCPGAPPDSDNSTKSGLSTGSVLLIVFFVCVAVYLFGGIIYNKIINGATGKELIPHIELWSNFHKLVLDGVLFTCNCCAQKPIPSTYDSA